jgi:hypothetical protein
MTAAAPDGHDGTGYRYDPRDRDWPAVADAGRVPPARAPRGGRVYWLRA